MATITFDQTGLSAGILDRARSDGLDDGSEVTITVAPSGGTVEFVDVPVGDVDSVGTLTQDDPSTWTFTPTASVYGTWLVQYVQGGSTVRRTFSVRTPEHGLRIPAFNEKASLLATIANGASHVADSDTNENDLYNGWFPALLELYQAVESGQPNPHGASHENGNIDEINVGGLSGVLADAQVADKVATSGTPVTIGSTPPSSGQVITASSATAAAWATPSVAVGGITGLGSGVGTFLATPSSANLATAVTDETGTGALVFATSPTLVTPALGTPASGVLTNCTGRVSANQTADQISTSGTPVTISSTAPTSGQVLQASSGTAAAWVTPVGSAFALPQVTATGPTTSNPVVNRLVFCDVSAGAVTVNLPAGHVAGDAMLIKLSSVATNSVTIDPNGAETIDGSSTLVLSNDYEWAWLISNGTNWFQIS